MDFDFGTTRRKVKGIVNGFDLCMLKRSFLEQNEASFFGTSRQCGGAAFWMDFSGKLCIYKCCNLCYTRTYRFHLPIDSRWKKRGSIRVLVKVPVNSKAAVGSTCTDRLLGYEV